MQQIDETLLAQARQGDETAIAALIARLMPFIRKYAARCTAPGLEFDDVVQEGLIGLFHALRSYDAAQSVTFVAYAMACIQHAQQDARRAALRKKHAPLNFSVPLPEDSTAPGPEELAIAREGVEDTLTRVDTMLSKFERTVLLAFLDGHTAAETAALLERSPKAVENALARARKKLRGTAPTP